ncbi:glycoside hydrolase family 9 protein [Streptomyces sp. NPDC058067]|uniref:glycoside hydrolase family 9 protein n=1 Tax=Streptomyces sp. NPDC058067 TaxID=3346324 RepID=UPI0036E9EB44
MSRPTPRMARVLDRLNRGGRRRLAVATVAGVVAGAVAIPVAVSAVGSSLGSAAAATPPQISKPAASKTGPAPSVQVNQVGYQTKSPKQGTFVTKSESPLNWTLKDADGKEVASGKTKPAGVDKSSGDNVHTFDFSKVTKSGKGYTVSVGGKKSEPFSIGDNTYSQLRTDSLAYFYHNRSGINIDADLVGKNYARPAGHVDGAASSDEKVPCQPKVCDYTLNVSKGWYDAGDYGKYVVNGGISVAQLMSSYERTLHTKGADSKALGDGRLLVPEHGNHVPDILDEARWEMDFLLSMQVPKGEKLAGMAHHKVHDSTWSGLPLRADKSTNKRELHAPSTAATLNLAATAAQAARLFEPYDKEFSAKALKAARAAFEAAKANPKMFADPGDATGGGAYSDYDVKDEFYWAASELFITTGDKEYRQEVEKSSLHNDSEALFPDGGISWQSVGGLGALDLATVPNKLGDAGVKAAQKAVTEAADRYAAAVGKGGYGVPYAPGGSYAWGSNGQILNNMVVLATAHDITGKNKYRDAVTSGMDYILGRNPMGMSYVTGYGARYAHNQHHRFWAHEKDAKLPQPAPGAVAGGPNSSVDDPVAQTRLKGCAPAKCYVDDIESWSTNEITINWNAPLAWVASYLDDQA